jgi:hypothetical protein
MYPVPIGYYPQQHRNLAYTEPSAFGMILPFGAASNFRSAASKQIAKATVGTGLASVAAAEDSTLMSGAATTTPMACYSAAYWVAVASRILNTRSGLATASRLFAGGTARDALPLSSQQRSSEDIKKVLSQGVLAIQTMPGATSNVEAMQAMMRLSSQVSSTSTTPTIGERIRDALPTLPEVPNLKWVPWAVGGTLAVGAALWIGMMVKNVRRTKRQMEPLIGVAGKIAAQAATRSNPRRRRSRRTRRNRRR